MQPATPNRKLIRDRILEKLSPHGDTWGGDFSHLLAINLFFDLSLEFDSLRDFKTLCVLIPDICLHAPASLYLRDHRHALRLRRTTYTHGRRQIVLPDPACPSSPAIIRLDDGSAVPICEAGLPHRLLGVLCLHRDLTAEEETFFMEYARRVALVMAVKQTAVSNRQRLTFINNLVRDIGHNVIVPNMQFKLLFMQMEKQISRLGHKVDALPGLSGDTLEWEYRMGLPGLVRDLQTLQQTVTKRFQQSSLFMESLLRRSHFENGRYDLMVKPCKFKSQVFEPQIERFSPLLRSQKIRCEIAPDVRIDEDILLDADLGLISQVFANLLANAVKYTRPVLVPPGREEKLLHYGWETVPNAFGTGNTGVRLFVSTTGPEIPRDEQPRLFDADFRSAAAESVEGTGHGLFFVKQIVELHKGRVAYSYASPMNVFSIVLPCPRQTSKEEESCPSPS